jgi:hypothetical protein
VFSATFRPLAVLLCSLQLAATNPRGELPQQLATPLPYWSCSRSWSPQLRSEWTGGSYALDDLKPYGRNGVGRARRWRTVVGRHQPGGHGAIGSAPALQAGGYGFESRWLHQYSTLSKRLYFDTQVGQFTEPARRGGLVGEMHSPPPPVRNLTPPVAAGLD